MVAEVTLSLMQPGESLYRALPGQHAQLHAIGDCVSPRQLAHANVHSERVG